MIATMSRRRPDSPELDQTGGERTKVKVRDLVKVFGPSPEAAVQLLMAGENADEIRSRALDVAWEEIIGMRNIIATATSR